jgi:hypothetical protein
LAKINLFFVGMLIHSGTSRPITIKALLPVLLLVVISGFILSCGFGSSSDSNAGVSTTESGQVAMGGSLQGVVQMPAQIDKPVGVVLYSTHSLQKSIAPAVEGLRLFKEILSQDGSFRFTNVPKGEYVLFAEQDGKRAVTQKGIQIQSQDTTHLQLALQQYRQFTLQSSQSIQQAYAFRAPAIQILRITADSIIVKMPENSQDTIVIVYSNGQEHQYSLQLGSSTQSLNIIGLTNGPALQTVASQAPDTVATARDTTLAQPDSSLPPMPYIIDDFDDGDLMPLSLNWDTLGTPEPWAFIANDITITAPPVSNSPNIIRSFANRGNAACFQYIKPESNVPLDKWVYLEVGISAQVFTAMQVDSFAVDIYGSGTVMDITFSRQFEDLMPFYSIATDSSWQSIRLSLQNDLDYSKSANWQLFLTSLGSKLYIRFGKLLTFEQAESGEFCIDNIQLW